MTTRTLAVVSAGIGQPSSTRLLADRLAAATSRALAERGVDVEVEVVELRDHARDLADNLLTGFASAPLQRAKDAVAGADGIVAVTPIFSGSYNALFKGFFDLLEPGSLDDRPVLVAATAGSARHALALDHALRPLFSYLRAVVVPTGVLAASEDWGAGGETEGRLGERIDRAGAQLATLVAAHEPNRPADPFADPTSFEQLLSQR